jgi:hypothetical protein
MELRINGKRSRQGILALAHHPSDDHAEPILREVFSALSQTSHRMVSHQNGMLVLEECGEANCTLASPRCS